MAALTPIQLYKTVMAIVPHFGGPPAHRLNNVMCGRQFRLIRGSLLEFALPRSDFEYLRSDFELLGEQP
jgi:hypothetical protein